MLFPELRSAQIGDLEVRNYSLFSVIVIFCRHGPIAAETERDDNGVQDCRAKAIKCPWREPEDLDRLGLCEEPRDGRHKKEGQ